MSATTMVLAPTVLLCLYFLLRRMTRERRALAVREAAVADGLLEPPTLHPVIDAGLCAGCATCIDVCPEGEVLGLIDGRAELVAPTSCIGHGACRTACPTEAITLVFGTERRGVDIPLVAPNFETNVPGIFIAGELGGMGLIRNAIEQGRQAIDSIRRLDGIGEGERLDVVIVGAGPAGISASLAAKQHGLRFVTLEQDSLGGTVAHYPRGKLVMTSPAHLPLVGKMRFGEVSKERLLEFWRDVERRAGLEIRYHERMEGIEGSNGCLTVRTTTDSYGTRAILLAIGRRGTPRRLGVPGESRSKVVYRLIDPEQFRGRNVLVVGGGDSALEAAISLADQPGTSVTISYRGEAFSRAKSKNRERLQERVAAGSIEQLLQSNVTSVEDDHVLLERQGRGIRLDNDAVVVCVGGVLPTPFLRQIGVDVETKHGTA
jgi:thioredoxin reductase/Pyruvate/2-oxoacid:ferredoxin oxidoreductase delta subunit